MSLIHRYQILLLGAQASGKTSLLDAVYEEFKSSYTPTLSSKTRDVTLHSSNGTCIFSVLDTSGQVCLPQSIKTEWESIPYVDGVIVAFDDNSITNFIQAVSYCNAVLAIRSETPIVLVGTKRTGQSSLSQTIREQLETWHKQLVHIQYLSTSASTGINLKEPFLHLARVRQKNAVLVWLTPEASTVATTRSTLGKRRYPDSSSSDSSDDD